MAKIDMADDSKDKYHPHYSPVSWGTLFFLLWVTLKTIGPNKDFGVFIANSQVWISYFILGVSLILGVSIFVTPLANCLKKERFERTFVPFVFYLSFLSYTAAWVGKFQLFFKNNGANTIDSNILVIFGFIWFIIFFMVMINSFKQILNLLFSSFCFAGSIYYLFFYPNKLGAIILIIVSLFLLFISAKIIPVNYSIYPDVE
jgi:hypothetical protein